MFHQITQGHFVAGINENFIFKVHNVYSSFFRFIKIILNVIIKQLFYCNDYHVQDTLTLRVKNKKLITSMILIMEKKGSV